MRTLLDVIISDKLKKGMEGISHDIEGGRYGVYELKQLVQRLGMEPKKVMISDIDCSQILPNDLSTHEEYINHVKRVMEVKKNKPIILGPGNKILDGRHRLTKRIIKGEDHIMAYVFDSAPEKDYK
jgi:hypothetical protein